MNTFKKGFFSLLVLFVAFPLIARSESFNPNKIMFEASDNRVELYEIIGENHKRMLGSITVKASDIKKITGDLNYQLHRHAKENKEVSISVEEQRNMYGTLNIEYKINAGAEIVQDPKASNDELLQCQSELEAYKEIVMGLSTNLNSGKEMKEYIEPYGFQYSVPYNFGSGI